MKRIVSLLICVLLSFALVSCKQNQKDSPKNNEKATTTDKQEKQTQEQTETSPLVDYGEYEELYKEIIDDYNSLISFRLADDFYDRRNNNIERADISDTLEKLINSSDDMGYRWGCMEGEMLGDEEKPTQDMFTYVLYDMNKDEVPELFWLREDDTILAIFTLHNDEILLLDAFWARYVGVITPNGELYTRASGGAFDTVFEIKELDENGELITKLTFGTESTSEYYQHFETVDGKKSIVSENRVDELLEEYKFENIDFE